MKKDTSQAIILPKPSYFPTLPGTPSSVWQVYAGPWRLHSDVDDCDRSPIVAATATATATALLCYSDDIGDRSPILQRRKQRRRPLSYTTATATATALLYCSDDDVADSPYLHLHLRLLPLISKSFGLVSPAHASKTTMAQRWEIGLRSKQLPLSMALPLGEGTSSKSMGPATGTERLRVSDATAKDYSYRSTFHRLLRAAIWDSLRAAAARRHLQRLLGHRLHSIQRVHVHTPDQLAVQIRSSAHLVHSIQ